MKPQDAGPAGGNLCLKGIHTLAFAGSFTHINSVRSEGGAHADAYVVVIRKADVLNPIQQAVEDGANLIQ